MLRQLVAAAAFAIALLVSPAIASQHTPKTATSTTLSEYDTESAAQKHCPSDTVVWLHTNSGTISHAAARR